MFLRVREKQRVDLIPEDFKENSGRYQEGYTLSVNQTCDIQDKSSLYFLK